jgi:hypothetical protein
MTLSEPEPLIPANIVPAVPRRRVLGAFIFSAVSFFVATGFYVSLNMPPYLHAVPQFTFLMAIMSLILLWQTLAERSMAKRISAWSSCIIWVLGIAVAFILKPTSSLIALSDGLLLLGFIPLLYLWRFSIPWILFGLFNSAIGFFLLLTSQLADSYFPQNLWAAKHHLSEYHPYFMWILFGAVTCLFGVARLSKNIFLMILRAQRGNRTPTPE